MDKEMRNSGHRLEKRKASVLYTLILLFLLAVFLFSLMKILRYNQQKKQSEAQSKEITEEYVKPVVEPEKEPEKEAEPPKEPEPEQIRVDLAGLQAKYPDVVGYIYCANTAYSEDTGSISFPVVRGTDNAFYLDHGVNGSYNINGAIFMDYRCEKDYSDQNTVIYGHRMWSGRMFAPLLQYKMQKFYNAHPCMYLYTPAQNYRLDLLAGCNVESVDNVYRQELSREKVTELMGRSTFRSNIKEAPENGNYVTLSTCDKNSSYQDPRYIVLCQMVPID